MPAAGIPVLVTPVEISERDSESGFSAFIISLTVLVSYKYPYGSRPRQKVPEKTTRTGTSTRGLTKVGRTTITFVWQLNRIRKFE